jgi:uncharacterized protein (TIRG00374 family)
MKQEKPGVFLPVKPTNRPIRLIRHPAPFFDEGAPTVSGIAYGKREDDDIAKQPTNRLSLFSDFELLNQHRAALTTLTPNDYQQIDEELDDTFNLSHINTMQLMQLSGMMASISMNPSSSEIKQALTGAMPAINAATIAAAKRQPLWKTLLNNSAAKAILGLAVGALVILLLARTIDLHQTLATMQESLTTPIGLLHIGLSGLAFVSAFTLRGIRWKLFLNRIEKVSVFKAVRVYWIGVFINFLLPVQGGELAKSAILKQVSGIPISQSLPTVAIDKALDLMPVLFIIVLVPIIPGVTMTLALWLILALVGGILIGLVVIIALTAWKRQAAIALINFFLRLLPKGIGGKIEGFAMGFVDSLLAGANQPKTFIPAVLLTAMAVTCEGLFAWEGFHAVNLNVGLGLTIFGYTVYTLCSILPSPPAGAGSNEGYKEAIFVGMLHFNKIKVLAMAVLVHVFCIILIGAIGMISLQTLGLKLSNVMQKQDGPQAAKK